MFDWNQKQKKAIQDWQLHIIDFVSRERSPALLWSFIGVLVAAAARLALFDHSFSTFAAKTYLPGPTSFDGLPAYMPYAILGIAFLFLLAVSRTTGVLRRGLKSWLAGCTSGIPIYSLLSTFTFLMLWNQSLLRHLPAYLGFFLFFASVSFVFYFHGRIHALRTITEEDIRVRRPMRKEAAGLEAYGAEPIKLWEHDALGRAAVVDILSSVAMIGNAPVIGLCGALGIGKTSVLNLLQTHLQNRAIVVRFVAWLPGSQDVLSSYLLTDIASECQKHYLVPGLRRSASRVARALAETVPFLKGAIEFIPTTTQRDDIIALQDALLRIPQRVIVLLDEIDRMEKEEVLTLLKMLRGIAQLQNCTFVCALDLDELIRTVRGDSKDDDRRYFEKFFPVTVELPKLDPGKLSLIAKERITQSFEREGWFDADDRMEEFESALNKCWDEMAAPFCKTLRTVWLLAGDIEIAAKLLRRQVDPLELTLIEILKRSKREVYLLVSRNHQFLTGGEGLTRGGRYVSDDQAKSEQTTFETELQAAVDPGSAQPINAILSRLFPKFAEKVTRPWQRHFRNTDAQNSNSISQPSMFSAYFQYEIPEAVFSSLELEQFLTEFRGAQSTADQGSVYRKTLTQLPKASLKRDDFLRRLAEAIKFLDQGLASNLALSVLSEAKEYTYDLFAGYGEAGHVIRIVIRTAEKMLHDDRVDFLRRGIRIASDDTLALRIITILTNAKSDAHLDVSYKELVPAFRERMRSSYGDNAQALTMDMSISDPQAFQQWGAQSEEIGYESIDRELQRAFWLRRIGNDRKKLAEILNGFFLPVKYQFSSDPTPYVEDLIPVADLRRLFAELPQIENPTQDEENALTRLEKFLAGEFQNGIPVTMN